MEIRKGIGVCAGYAIERARVLDRGESWVKQREIAPDRAADEAERFLKAHRELHAQLESQVKTLSRRMAPGIQAILESHLALLGDAPTRDEIVDRIRRQSWTAEYAVSRTLKARMKVLENAREHVFTQRILQDLAEIEAMILRKLAGRAGLDPRGIDEPCVLVAHSLSPSEAAALDREKIRGLLLDAGGRTSHVSIVARTLGIPCIVGLETITRDVTGGDVLIVDGSAGTVIISPDEGTRKRYRAMGRNFELAGERLLKEVAGVPAVTKDGHPVEILANIEFPEEITPALRWGAEGVGLYRTEFLFVGRDGPPTEADHLEQYRRSVRLLAGRKLVIRTLDLGADKMPLDGMPKEENPFLGTRAIRLCLERRDLFEPQLRAVLRASTLGPLWLMFPLITSVREIHEVRRILENVRGELARRGEASEADVPLGIMVETPAAALAADLLAPYVDFFSIGSNDLVACTMAVDRGNEKVASLFSPAHPAVIRMLKRVIEVGSMTGKAVSLCGEMSSDVTYTMLLLGVGLKSFSVVPPVIPEVKKLIRSVSLQEARAVAEKVLTHDDEEETMRFLREETSKILPDVV